MTRLKLPWLSRRDWQEINLKVMHVHLKNMFIMSKGFGVVILKIISSMNVSFYFSLRYPMQKCVL